MQQDNEIVLFKSQDGQVSLPVPTDGATVWLTQAQMAMLFDKDRTVIGRHIRNAIEEGEIDPKVACANFAHTTRHGAIEGKLQFQEFVGYNLDVVISVGYRVHSLRGVEFRRWATSVLKDYILHGYAVNRKRLAQLGQAVEVMKRTKISQSPRSVGTAVPGRPHSPHNAYVRWTTNAGAWGHAPLPVACANDWSVSNSLDAEQVLEAA